MALACGLGLAGCGKTEAKVSVDLDGDGKISTWETLFGNGSSSSEHTGETITITKPITYIKSKSDLLAINDAVKTSPLISKAYVLSNDIDLGGEEVCINLGNSELYGNTYTISNFKLGTYYVEDYITSGVDGEEVAVERTPSGTRCLFYGGSVYGVNIFMGVQSVSFDNIDIDNYQISPFINSSYIDYVSVRGKLNLNAPYRDGRSNFSVNASLLYSQAPISEIIGEAEVETEPDTHIRNVSVAGVIKVHDEERFLSSNIGGVASVISENSTIYNANVEIDLDVDSKHEMNVGGIIGHNKGFVSTGNVTGRIKSNFTTEAKAENVGGVVGFNSNGAEIKNCKTNATIDFAYSDILVSSSTSANHNYGGIAGYNVGGVLEYVQSDSVINVSNVTNITVGGIAGKTEMGIISHAICRGSININDVLAVNVAQVSGRANKGLIESVLTTTGITVDNSLIQSSVNVGMVTIFENFNNTNGDGYTAQNSPYFKGILVDGKTEVYMRQGDAFKYALGLRNPYRIQTGEVEENEETGETIVKTESRLPEIFTNLYYTEAGGYSSAGCQLLKYELVNGVKTKNETVKAVYPLDNQNIRRVSKSSNTVPWLIDTLDFKGYLNHNEVNLTDKIVFSELNFTLDKSVSERSYFGEHKYNGELAYFDREFTESYTHEDSSVGSCGYDNKDELMSFIYDLMINAKDVSTHVIKISDGFLKVDWDNAEQSNLINFRKIIKNSFTCLNTDVKTYILNMNKQNIDSLDEDDLESGEGQEFVEDTEPKYLKVTFEDNKNNYIMLIDIESLVRRPDGVLVTKGDYSSYMLYLTFSVIAKSPVQN